MMWLLQKGVVWVVDKVVESVEFSLRVWWMKATCMVDVVREQVDSRKSIHGESSTIMEPSQPIHASVKAFIVTYITSYLCLGELDLGGLRQQCNDLDAKDIPA